MRMSLNGQRCGPMPVGTISSASSGLQMVESPPVVRTAMPSVKRASGQGANRVTR